MKVFTYDTTLRDGAQSETIFFSQKEKINIIRLLDSLGIDFIEIGNPFYDSYDKEFFDEVKNLGLLHSKIVAFGGTCHAGKRPEDDPVINFLSSFADHCTVFGKAWDLHVSDVLKTTLEENLRIIHDSIKFLKDNGRYVFFDAEHFFDGWRGNREYALKVLETARNAGADEIVLCDTNGGTFPKDIESAVRDVKEKISVKLGIHTHNDNGLAVANSLSAVEAGVESIQGTINGIGERCGNANLSTLIANLQVKAGYTVLDGNKIRSLTGVASSIAKISNISVNDMPYISSAAFTHKAGTHADAVRKNPATFEHIDPYSIGNKRTILLSEISGKNTILPVIQRVDPTLDKNSEKVDHLVSLMRAKEAQGYHFETAQASLELMIIKELGLFQPHFVLDFYKVINEARAGEMGKSIAVAEVSVGHQKEMAATDGDGPVLAIGKVLRKALREFYPSVDKFQLINYEVQAMDNRSATGATVRVLIESTDGKDIWSTVGISIDIIHASQAALVDAIEYKLLKDENKVSSHF